MTKGLRPPSPRARAVTNPGMIRNFSTAVAILGMMASTHRFISSTTLLNSGMSRKRKLRRRTLICHCEIAGVTKTRGLGQASIGDLLDISLRHYRRHWNRLAPNCTNSKGPRHLKPKYG
ncbi:hypothetical protein PRUPE_8G075300 [Prunus persica]|uniref:Uncharacterized protein n=1 Tax=Prunus persica TaxID=3760 RepID=A0A251MXP9_PRUPE|nr:hypothetical protein PRUPE_8G075300 [Prunus persica]